MFKLKIFFVGYVMIIINPFDYYNQEGANNFGVACNPSLMQKCIGIDL